MSVMEKNASEIEKRTLKIDRSNKELPVLKYETKCRAKFSFGAEQRVDLQEEPISP